MNDKKKITTKRIPNSNDLHNSILSALELINGKSIELKKIKDSWAVSSSYSKAKAVELENELKILSELVNTLKPVCLHHDNLIIELQSLRSRCDLLTEMYENQSEQYSILLESFKSCNNEQ